MMTIGNRQAIIGKVFTMEQQETPEELQTWADAQIEVLRERVAFLEEASQLHRGDAAAWSRHVAEASSQIRRTGYELEYLTSCFALSEGLVGATEISRAIGLTPASMYHRLTTKIAKRLMLAVFGRSRQLRVPEVS